MLTTKTKDYMQELDRQQEAHLEAAGRSVDAAIRRLRVISLLLKAWRRRESVTPCLAALGAEPETSPLDAAEAALGDFIFEVSEITGSLHDWDRLEQIRHVHGDKEARFT